MLIKSKGLVSKTKVFPLATWLFFLLTLIFSYFNFPIHEKAKSVYYKSPHRLDYAHAAQEYIKNNCNDQQAKSYCKDLKELPLETYLFSAHLTRFDKTNLKHKSHYFYINEELQPERLKLSKPSLYEKQVLAQKDLDNLVESHQLLSRSNINWLSGLKSLFQTTGWLQIIFSFFLLSMIAKPLEEKMGPFFFTINFAFCGFLGNATQAFLLPESFYVIGPTAAISGCIAAYLFHFHQNFAILEINLFGKAKRNINFPVLGFSLLLLGGLFSIDKLNPYIHNHLAANIVGFIAGILFAKIFNLILPLPKYYVFPYELTYRENATLGYSQWDKVKVYLEWIYFAPYNLDAFSGLVKELERSSGHSKVNLEISKFRQKHFYRLYRLNRKTRRFMRLIPLEWLRYTPTDDRETHIIKFANEFKEKRDFANAFKMCFLILNQKSWKDKHWRTELFKNYKKATVSPQFRKNVASLIEHHSGFRALLIY